MKYRMRFLRNFLLIIVFISFGCSKAELAKRGQNEKEMTLSEINLPNLVPKPIFKNKNSALEEGSYSEKLENHPEITKGQRQFRAIKIPKEVDGKWKAVKLKIKDKQDQERLEVKIVNLGESFALEEADLTVTVGAFFPNFVMDEDYYSSLGNEPINPAVQFVVHERDKRIFEGWAFKRFPKLYGFEHERYEILLTDYIPTEVS